MYVRMMKHGIRIDTKMVYSKVQSLVQIIALPLDWGLC